MGVSYVLLCNGSNDPDYDEDKNQLEEEQKQKIREINKAATTNQIF
ncbi:MAG TPA: hypothetical protein VI278_10965 [Nitrososphaeraceae archaeon]